MLQRTMDANPSMARQCASFVKTILEIDTQTTQTGGEMMGWDAQLASHSRFNQKKGQKIE